MIRSNISNLTVQMLPPEYIYPVFASVLVLLLLVWIGIPCVFATALIVKMYWEGHEAQWFEAENRREEQDRIEGEERREIAARREQCLFDVTLMV